jgi:formiminoglutamase
MAKLTPPDSALFFSRKDSKDPRLGELIKAKPADGEGVAILGYPDDEGIQLNGGRTGANEGPREIRRWLYRMTPHPRRELKSFWDLGDLKPGGELVSRHESARSVVKETLESGAQVLSLGGGNDYAYADGMGFLDHSESVRPLIVNIDAHLDVRDTSRGLSSGTPFYRLLESGAEFDFLEFGIQGQCNSRAHWEYVEGKGGKIVSLEEILDSSLSLSEYTVQACGDWILRPRPAFLAIDMDAFAWPYAVGTSAAWPVGLDPNQFWTLLQTLLRRLNVSVLGIYEVSPALDNGGGTAKLAAQWAHCFLHHS